MTNPTQLGRFDARGTLALLGTVVFWAAIPVFLRGLKDHVDHWTANGVRYPLAAILFWPTLAAARRRGTLDSRVLRLAVVPACLALGGQILWALAPYHISASLIGFLVKLSILWGLAGAMILFPEERPILRSSKFWIGGALAIAGLVTLVLARGALDEELSFTGLAVMIGCTLFFGAYGVSVRLFFRGTSPLVSFGVVAQYTSVGTITLMLCFGAPATLAEAGSGVWGMITASAIMGIAISHALYYTAIQRLGAAISNLGHLLGPFITLALAHFALGERLEPLAWIGGVTLVVGGGLLISAQTRMGAASDIRAPQEPARPSR